MGKIKDRFKKLFTNSADISPELGEKDILEWLGIDQEDLKAKNSAVYFTCLKILSESLGKMPIKYYQKTEKGKRQVHGAPLHMLLSVRPNAFMTPTTFWGTVENNINHYGNAYVWIRKRRKCYGAEVADLWIMPAADTTVLVDDMGVFGGEKGDIYYRYTDRYSHEVYVFDSAEVMHFKNWFSFDGLVGESTRNILKNVISGDLESQSFMNQLYEKGMTASMALEYTGELSDNKVNALRKKYESYVSGAKNAGRIVPIPVGFKLTPLNVKLTDSQFFELKKYSALQIAASFGVKPNQLNNYEKSSYANSESQQLSFLVETMLYKLKQYEEEINYKLLSTDQLKDGYWFKFNEKALLRTDTKTQIEFLSQAINNGIYKPNEARELVDAPWAEGGDVLMVNGNYIPITQIGSQYGKGED